MARQCERTPARRKKNNLDQFFEMVYQSDEETARKLIQPSSNIRNSSGRTLIDNAIHQSNPDKLRQFAGLGCDINILTNGQTPLFSAIKLSKLEIACVLLELSADVNIKSTWVASDTNEESGGDVSNTEDTHYALSPLYLAVQCNHTEMVDLLIKHGSKTDEASLLHSAIRIGNPNILRKLLYAGAFVDQEDHKEWTPLATAIIKEKSVMSRMLLEHGADVHKAIPFLELLNSNKIFVTPLLLCTVFDITMIPMLLSAGGDPCAGHVPHGTAQRMDLKWCMAPLCSSLGRNAESLKYFLCVNCPLYWQPGDHAPTKAANPDDMFQQHDSALYMALFKKGKASVKLLLRCGFDISRCAVPTREIVRKIIDDKQNMDLVSLLEDRFMCVQPLMLLARNTIRQNIGYGIEEKIDRLRLPPAVVDYILLRDIFVM